MADRSTIDEAEVRGEAHTGYENSGGKGPFECRNCYYSFEDSTCSNPIMKKYSREPRASSGRVRIDPRGCCEYVWRKGKR